MDNYVSNTTTHMLEMHTQARGLTLQIRKVDYSKDAAFVVISKNGKPYKRPPKFRTRMDLETWIYQQLGITANDVKNPTAVSPRQVRQPIKTILKV